MGLLSGKRVLVTGVLNEASLAFAVARVAQQEGAEILLTGFGRGMSITRRTAKRLPSEVEVLEFDTSSAESAELLGRELGQRWPEMHGVLHAIGFAPQSCLGHGVLDVPWEDSSVALQVSAQSLQVLASLCAPLMRAAGGGSVVGLDFDASVAWPGYDWMGVCKAAFESLARYLARDLGPDNIRVNLVSAGPVRTIAARSIPAFDSFEGAWAARAPLGWEVTDSDAVARACVALLSDWFPKTTGEIIHVDGGYHAVGA